MPVPYLKKLSKEGKGSVKTLEKKWDKAGDIAKKAGKGDNYAYRTGILKRSLGIKAAIVLEAKQRLLGGVPLLVNPVMVKFWERRRKEGKKPDTLYAIQHQVGSTQPPGYLMGWGANPEAMRKQMADYVAEYPKAKVTLVPITPQFA